MWRPRDRERYIGGYDPEREMPNPDRDRGDRYQSDVYRNNARDGRFAYRWNPDRVEGRYDRALREAWERGYRAGIGESGYDREYDRDFSPRYGHGEYDRGYDDYDRDRDRWRR